MARDEEMEKKLVLDPNVYQDCKVGEEVSRSPHDQLHQGPQRTKKLASGKVSQPLRLPWARSGTAFAEPMSFMASYLTKLRKACK